ncbi:CAP domain-containing protein [Actinoallomurus sp. CA-150999]|uniref:CAP domain-containing protein n=1 Tax=Actinoallomurus sp. CA-150999 TaxID=3239887 RepID=UPI003D91A568
MNHETQTFWDKPDPARSTTVRRRRRRRPMRWATIGVAGTVGLGAVVGVAYAATGGSGGSGKQTGARSAAAGATTSPQSDPVPDAPKPTKRKSHKKTHKPTPRKSHPKTHKPAPATTRHVPASAPVAGGPTGKAAQYAAQVLSITNSERAQHGCGPLTINAKLARAAQGHSADMVARRFFDHTNPDGKGPGERLAAVGYASSAWGENIAAGQQTPAAVMDSWMHSPGHRANILNCGFHAIGIGVAFGSSTPYGTYWTQDFGSDR